jgi:hypothetical protein
MATTTYWSPNQALIAQVETYVFSAPNSIGNTYTATINGKSITYTSVMGDTAATVVSALYNLLLAQSQGSNSGILELTEITFANPSSATITATAVTPGTPFANVTVNGVPNQGLILTTGNGLTNGITTTHTQPNQSPSDISDPQNWLRVTTPAPGTRSLPQSGDAVVVGNSSTPMLWNLDLLIAVQFASYTRTQDMTGQIGLPITNPKGYQEWRAPYFRFVGPQGSVPAGGLTLILGPEGNGGNGPTFESYNVGSQLATLTIIAGNTVNFLGVHTLNTFTLLGDVTLNVAMNPGEISTLNTCLVNSSSDLFTGPGVTWTTGATLTVNTGSATLNSAPTTLTLVNGANLIITTDQLTWPTITAQNGCTITFLAGGTITSLTMTTGCKLDKSQDARPLTITAHTLDGDTCQIIDPLTTITFTNAGTVKQQVVSGPYIFTGPRTVKVT